MDDTGGAVLDVIARSAETWRLLLEYDEDRLAPPLDNRPSAHALEYGGTVATISLFKRELMNRGEASPLFGNLRGDALKGLLGSIEQTMFGEPLYRRREEKAAHLLYFVEESSP